MFKPHFDICICHNEKRLIVVKKGYCAEGNYEQKQKNKKSTSNDEKRHIVGYEKEDELVVNTTITTTANRVGKRHDKNRSFVQKNRKTFFKPKKGTGEKEIFEEIAAEREWVCFVTQKNLMELTATQFGHVLPKALNKYPLFKLHKPNIQLFSNEIHYRWDHMPRSTLVEPMWKKLFELEAELKEEYKNLKI